jgi:NADH-quinone oxidoreductase subunit B
MLAPTLHKDSITQGRNLTGEAPALPGLIANAVSRSLWPLMLGLDYATLEVFHALGPHHDLARWGSEVFRPSPRQVDVLLVPGVVTRKMAPVLLTLHEAMAEPRFVVAIGSGAISGAPFAGSYSVVTNLHELLPVDVFVPGDPPRPEAIIAGIVKLGELIRSGRNARPQTMARYDAKRWPTLWTAMVDAGMGESAE